MKKLLLGIILLAALAAIVYVQTMRESAHETGAFERGKAAGLQTGLQGRATADSLVALVAQRDDSLAAMADSLEAKDCAYADAVDSLTSVVESRDQELAELKKRTDKVQTPESSATRAGTSTENDILAHYRLAVKKLPGDLSPYERAVAIREIRQETATKFAITVDKLNQIRETNHLEY